MGAGNWPGVRYEAGGANWQAYETLACDVYNPGDSFGLTFRIDDRAGPSRYDDRFNRKMRIHPGWNRIRLPLDEIRSGPRARELDVAAIARVSLFGAKTESGPTFYLDNVRLIPPVDRAGEGG